MLPGWVIFASAFGYLLLLFAVASYGDRKNRGPGTRQGGPGTLEGGWPVVYALSLAIYCTSWTYFGSVGLAAQRGLEFAGIYIGPILVFTLGMPLLRRIIELAKAEKLTSVADFVAARYGKNSTVATIVALISLIGAIPYIALQLKAISSTVSAMVNPSDYGIGSGNLYFLDLPLVATLVLACFAIMFGTRHTDATEHQDGLILAVSMESVVKLVAFLTAGVCVIWFLFDGPTDLWRKTVDNELVMSALSYHTPISRWITLILLSAFAIILLPRQFHVTVVENRTPKQLKLAGFLFPTYLISINLFVLPVAIGGLLTFGGSGNADFYMLSLPLAGQMPVISLIIFIGGFSAATAMVIVDSVALSIMVSNDIIMPIFLRRKLAGRASQRDNFAKTLLNIRRSAIFAVLLFGYAYYRSTDSTAGLASIGLLSFAAIAQIAPALFGGLIWRRANARGAILGLTSGFVIWIYLLFLPSLGGPDYSYVASAVLGFIFPGTTLFTAADADPLVNATAMSLLVNTAFFIVGSLTRNARPLERIQAGIFVKRHSRSQFATRGWKTRISVGDLKAAISRYLGEERMQRSLTTYEQSSGRKLEDEQPADMALIHFSEQLLGSAIGSSSARLVLSLILQKIEDASSDTAWLLDQASEALQYNQDMLQTALSQMDQGIAVFDSSNRLTIWNRRFRQLLDLPESAGQVGFPLSDIVTTLSQRGDIAPGDLSQTVRHFLTLDKPFSLVLGGGERIIEVRSNAMPDKGIVATFTDITQRVSADQALKQANETLEQRVAERTAELTRVNHELGEARAAADEANIGKTRFFAAAGHDILQPLNAARLYSSALVERMAQSDNSLIVRNIDSALESVETILGAVLDISRLDTGAMRPRLASVALSDLLKRIETDFAPIAREKQLKLVVMPTSLRVRSDPNLLRRLVQNLVSNAIKYTISGKVLVGARRRGNQVIIQVIDSGIGIPPSKFRTVFKEFARLDEGAKTASGLGLGLSIVDRIARVLNHPVELQSTHGRGTEFRIAMPLDVSRPAEATVAVTPADRPGQPLSGLKILCIDNEPKILEGMRLLISGWGCEVAALDCLADVISSDGRDGPPDIVIADYHLGDGTGIAAILHLRRQFGADIPALLITADRTPEVRSEAERYGIAVQHKPVRPAALRAYITQISGLKRAAAE
ncbi:hybrid sensor histidine kinase/response regulator [Rhizobium ruizarguesonis]|uniref:PAS domain-containing hybrid sensor histidine kinase/response regulator n=1 Tax=Rhizobium ruizarguesonis TaxID=2081791 RepID=UPI001030B812|nr:hybrid sensor histidine kinase/response regulator [Rhizobium ruizarguesonis]TAU46780.1 hybrid sensor histidine kinase/response regulator [Rhizobium ruizarguesonis]TAU61852.1 hybrid sensor histidine kinase/response regulator [Rhizobium ruizarguesonis]TBA88571.1 hybrid sensor histidine kinase/response regulator [Rhizobium ruizarguesonis]